MSNPISDPDAVRRKLLGWYDAHRRELPWRAAPGRRADAYAVWLSEIMLQQTTVVTVGPYFGEFMARWPTVGVLADASLDEVLIAWQGLGYYARARNLHRCAQVVSSEHGGNFPDTEAGLRALPGVGPYTAAAIAAIAFDRAAMPVDGNIERVTARLFVIDTPLPAGKAEIAAAAQNFLHSHRPGDFAQAMMDLGATICTPTSPKCMLCPLREQCGGHAKGVAETLPKRAPKRTRPERRAVIFWLENGQGEVLLRKRPERGLLGGMMEFPSTDWREGDWPGTEELEASQPFATDWHRVDGEAVHTFTHFRLTMRVYRGRSGPHAGAEGIWVAPSDFAEHALPTVMKKVVSLATDGGGSGV